VGNATLVVANVLTCNLHSPSKKGSAIDLAACFAGSFCCQLLALHAQWAAAAVAAAVAGAVVSGTSRLPTS